MQAIDSGNFPQALRYKQQDESVVDSIPYLHISPSDCLCAYFIREYDPVVYSEDCSRQEVCNSEDSSKGKVAYNRLATHDRCVKRLLRWLNYSIRNNCEPKCSKPAATSITVQLPKWGGLGRLVTSPILDHCWFGIDPELGTPSFLFIIVRKTGAKINSYDS